MEFLGIAATNEGSQITARSGASFDQDYTLGPARGRHVVLIVREEVAKPDQAAASPGRQEV